MGSPVSIDEYALLNFFSAAPTQFDPDDPWAYNDSSYEAADEVAQVCFAIAPAYKDVRLLLTVGGTQVFEFSAMGVDDVRYHREKGHESLEVIISPRNSIWLSIKPRISIHQSVSAGPTE
ncbi:MAG: hypothetical protein NTV52_36100 [Acidobacteria bacterium]|nr:hypothetical protein [Acidobacteriota bacterium]